MNKRKPQPKVQKSLDFTGQATLVSEDFEGEMDVCGRGREGICFCQECHATLREPNCVGSELRAD